MRSFRSFTLELLKFLPESSQFLRLLANQLVISGEIIENSKLSTAFARNRTCARDSPSLLIWLERLVRLRSSFGQKRLSPSTTSLRAPTPIRRSTIAEIVAPFLRGA